MADYVGTVDEGKEITLYGTGWGVLGAAMASSIAFCVGGILITIVLFRHPVISPKGPCLWVFFLLTER